MTLKQLRESLALYDSSYDDVEVSIQLLFERDAPIVEKPGGRREMSGMWTIVKDEH